MAMVADGSGPGGPLLRVRGLSAAFGPVVALRDIDLDVSAGEVVAIAGDNGAGKTTLLRCISGDVTEATGEVWLAGSPVTGGGLQASHDRLGFVWQHLELSDNLDIAATVMLGRERRRLLTSRARTHSSARAVLDDLGIPLGDTTRLVKSLTAAERQLLAIVRSASPRPRLLLLDEPTAVLSRRDSAHVERLILRLRDEGTTVVLVSHDVEQLFRLADRVVVLRHGRIVAEVDPTRSHTDEVVALMAGLDTAAAPRRQLTRLGGLADQLTSADHPGSLTLILSTLGAALGIKRVCLHLVDGDRLRSVASVGIPPALDEAWRALPLDDASPVARAAHDDTPAIDRHIARGCPAADLMADAGIASWWAVPFAGGTGLTGVISILPQTEGEPAQDQLALVNLYAGYAANTLERERLVGELTARNKVLEAIREVLQTLAGPDPVTEGVEAALRTLRRALDAEELTLYETSDGRRTRRAYAVAPERRPSAEPDPPETDSRGGRQLIVPLSDAAMLVAVPGERPLDRHERTLLEDAGHSILLALDRERAEKARREAAALRRSQQMQRQFLARLSHELRTPLTAIRGYASSLLQTDVTWDDASTQRFLRRISAESARLRRLVDDLLDFSLIESGMLRLRPDWVDLPLVIDAARACLPPPAAAAVTVECRAGLPPLWADHDRLEQMLVNLMDNAVRHTPLGTSVKVCAYAESPAAVVVEVSDDGGGFAAPRGEGQGEPDSSRPDTAGAGLGLSITEGIVGAHHGSIRRCNLDHGTRFTIRLPVEDSRLSKEADHD